MKKRAFIVIAIICLLLYLNLNSLIPVKYAISIFNAYWEVKNENAIIVYYDDDGLGSYYKKGLNREYITLIGRNPYNEVSGRLLKNKILIKGEFQKDISEFYSKKIFKVTDWNIIFPVTRTYSLSDYQKSRLIGPIFFVDQFDIDTGDFCEYVNADKSISSIEAEFLAYAYDTNYFIVTPEVLENAVKWHKLQYTMSKEYNLKEAVSKETIKLKGVNLPEDCLNKDVLFNGSIQKYINKFLIHGYRQDDSIYVDSWQIITPFENRKLGANKNFLNKNDFSNK